MWTKLVLAAVVLIGACGTNTGPSERGEVRVMLTRLPDTLVIVPPSGVISIPLAAVDSLILTITAVEAIPSRVTDDETDEPGGFIRLGLTNQGREPINLLALPLSNPVSPGLLIAEGEIEAGAYDRIRLRFDPNTARISLTQPITVDGVMIQAGRHPLAITTGAQTGVLAVGSEFTVAENAPMDIELMFEAARTLSEVRFRGDTVLLKPTFRLGRIDQ